MDITELIPAGHENAISRKRLVQECIRLGVVSERGADRQVRKMIADVTDKAVILNMSDGKGYFIPTPEDQPLLQKHIHQEYSRAMASLRRISREGKLNEDYKKGRITNGGGLDQSTQEAP